MARNTIISSNEYYLVIDILKLLSNSEYISEYELRNKLNNNKDNLKSILYSMEYMNIIEVHNKKIKLKSNILSLLYETLIYYEGTERFIKDNILENKSTDNKFVIPAFLLPLLLIRSITPYFGLILKEIENEGLLTLSPEKKEFILNFFEPLNYLNSSKIENYKNLVFSSEEFYNMWYIVNKKLVDKINLKSTNDKYGKKILLSKELINEKSNKRILDDFINTNNKLITSYKSKYKENNLILMTIIKTNIDMLLSFIEKSFYNPNTLKIYLYKDNVIKWIYSDEKGKLPIIIIKNDGIYMEEKEITKYKSNKVNHQINYIYDIIKMSKGGDKYE